VIARKKRELRGIKAKLRAMRRKLAKIKPAKEPSTTRDLFEDD